MMGSFDLTMKQEEAAQSAPRPDDEQSTAEEPLLPTYSEDGVDLTLIRWMLSLTPAERVAVLEGHVDDVLRVRALNADR